MGFFSKPTLTCGVCQREIGSKDKRWKTADSQHICAECQKPYGILNGPRAFANMTCVEIKNQNAQIRLNAERRDSIQCELKTFERSVSIDGRLHIDEKSKRWYIGTIDDANVIYSTDDIERISISIGGKVANTTTITSRKGTISRAVVGGILAGGVGAVVGAMTSKNYADSQTIEHQTATVSIGLKENHAPLEIVFLNPDMARQARDALIEAMGAKIENSTTASNVDEIRKYKELLDDGVITQDEFDAKKKQLLGL